jgi:hypothetical protein
MRDWLNGEWRTAVGAEKRRLPAALFCAGSAHRKYLLGPVDLIGVDHSQFRVHPTGGRHGS